MRKVISIRGPTGAGKSTVYELLRRRLVDTYAWLPLNRAAIKDDMLKAVKFHDRKKAQDLSKKVIFELANENPEYNLLFQEFATVSIQKRLQGDYELHSFFISVSPEESFRRTSARSGWDRSWWEKIYAICTAAEPEDVVYDSEQLRPEEIAEKILKEAGVQL